MESHMAHDRAVSTLAQICTCFTLMYEDLDDDCNEMVERPVEQFVSIASELSPHSVNTLLMRAEQYMSTFPKVGIYSKVAEVSLRNIIRRAVHRALPKADLQPYRRPALVISH